MRALGAYAGCGRRLSDPSASFSPLVIAAVDAPSESRLKAVPSAVLAAVHALRHPAAEGRAGAVTQLHAYAASAALNRLQGVEASDVVGAVLKTAAASGPRVGPSAPFLVARAATLAPSADGDLASKVDVRTSPLPRVIGALPEEGRVGAGGWPPYHDGALQAVMGARRASSAGEGDAEANNAPAGGEDLEAPAV